MVNVPTLKGVHYAIRAGMLAAESIVEALKREETDFSAYDDHVDRSEIGRDLFESRNMRAPFSKGFFIGGAIASAMTITKGTFPGGKWDYEPDPEDILATLVPDYVEISIFRALLESTASEHGARMSAMRNASDNAAELIDDLTLAANRQRQAEITQEIMEVVAGAEGLT